jgi:hypothetical protein
MGKRKKCVSAGCTSSNEEPGMKFFNFPRDSARYEPDLKYYYKTYCKILASINKGAKNLHYNKLIPNSKTASVTPCVLG